VFLLDTLLLAPGKAVLLMFEELAKKAQEEFLDDASVKQELQDIYGLLEGGTISEAEFEARESRLLERLEQIARAKFQGEWGTSDMGMQRAFMDSAPREGQDLTVSDPVMEGEILPEVLSNVDVLIHAGESAPVVADRRPVIDAGMMSALRPLIERFVGGQGRQSIEAPATLLPPPAAALAAAPPIAPQPEVARPEAPSAAPAVITVVPPVAAAFAPPIAAVVAPPVATTFAPPIANSVAPAGATTGFASPVVPAVAPPVPAASAAAAPFAPPAAAAVVPPAAAPAVTTVGVCTPPLTMMQVVESSLRQLSMLKMKVSAITAVARSDDGWRVTAEMLERKGVPDTSDLLGVYELQLDEAGNVLRYERTHIRRRCDLGR
jgi:hypothetical protein